MAGRRVYSFDFEMFVDLEQRTETPIGATLINRDAASGKEFFRLPASYERDRLAPIAGRAGVQATPAAAKRAWQLYYRITVPK